MVARVFNWRSAPGGEGKKEKGDAFFFLNKKPGVGGPDFLPAKGEPLDHVKEGFPLKQVLRHIEKWENREQKNGRPVLDRRPLFCERREKGSPPNSPSKKGLGQENRSTDADFSFGGTRGRSQILLAKGRVRNSIRGRPAQD